MRRRRNSTLAIACAVKFGFILPNFGDKITAEQLVEISRVCEESGFDSVWATDHVIMPVEQREPYGQLLEPLVTLSFVAAATKKLRVGTSIIVLPQRNPILLAKQVAALDVFSRGRVILGAGAGWAEKEFLYLNADFRRRGSVFDESIRLIRRLWADDVIDFEGKYFNVKGAIFLPKPAQKHVPVWIGGGSEAAARRAARLGDGWHPVGLDVDAFRRGAEIAREGGRRLTLSIRMTVDVRKRREPYVAATGERRVAVSGSSEEIIRQIEEYEEAGLEYFCASVLHPRAEDIIADLKVFSSEIMGSFS